ncbi:MAG: M28 family peptidase [Candidatus Helarchaeota archaeon]|nr:M28 family peptidase [Candidatus Helarchaeota archaeon]
MNDNNTTSKLFEHITNLDYPRKSGSEGEKNAAKYISSIFSKYGYEPIHEKFGYFSSSPIRSVLFFIIFTGYLSLSLINLAYLDNIIISIFTITVPIIIIIVFVRIDIFFKRMIKGHFKRFSKIEKMDISKKTKNKSYNECENIIAEYIHPNYTKHLYITCHYDTISLRLPMKALFPIIIIGFLSYLGYIILYILEFVLNFFDLELFTSYWYIYLLLCLFAIIFLNMLLIVRRFRTNVSHGSIDDATGISITLELSHIVKEINPRLKITFIAFSSEEVGFYGSSYHYYKNKDLFNKETQIISIDMIGEVPPLCYVKSINPIKKIKTDNDFNQEIKKIARDSKIGLKGIKFFYPGSDFAVWLLNGYKANWIYSKSRYIHSKNDKSSKVNKKLMTDCFKLFVKYFEKYV